jgi:hypothetical protein
MGAKQVDFALAMSQVTNLYPPLHHSTQEIRLLSMCDDEGSRLAYKISVFDLSNIPHFVALSYVWGPPGDTHEIDLNGQPFLVRENLYSALKSISEHIELAKVEVCQSHRSQGSPVTDAQEGATSETRNMEPLPGSWKYFWIDAICINQSAISERNHQVRLMSDIYKTAQAVLVWLGPSCEGALDVIATAKPCDLRAVFKPYTDRFVKSKFSQPLIPLFETEYWTRMWIVQEFVLATSIVFASGRTVVSWEKVDPLFPHTYAYRGSGKYSSSITLVNERRQHEFRSQQHIRPDLHELVRRFGLMDCSDRRDRIFALFGLMKEGEDGSRDVLLVDYSLTPAQLALKTLRLAGRTIKRRVVLESFHNWLKEALEVREHDASNGVSEELCLILDQAMGSNEEIETENPFVAKHRRNFPRRRHHSAERERQKYVVDLEQEFAVQVCRRPRPLQMRIRRACEPCRQQRLRCDGDIPCQACVLNEVECHERRKAIIRVMDNGGYPDFRDHLLHAS